MGKRASGLLDELVATTTLKVANTKLLERPDRIPRALLAGVPWGSSTIGAIAGGCARYPHATAVIDEDGELSFGELWKRSDQLARALVESGLGPGRRVGLLSRNHRGFVEALVAVAKVGADLVFLNPEFAPPQLADVVEAERLERVLHDRDCAHSVTECGVGWALEDAAPRRMSAASSRPAGFLRPPAEPGRMVILTSGTTGRPKGASHRAGGGAQGAAGILSGIPLRPRDTQVVAAPLFHGWGLTNLVLGLSRSATTILRRGFDPASTLDAIAVHRANVLVVVPVMLQRILAQGPHALIASDISRLRIIASSGSALGEKLVRETLDRLGPVLYNLYGSTEVAVATIAGPWDLSRNPGSAGRPVPGARVEILDDGGRMVSRGETGRDGESVCR